MFKNMKIGMRLGLGFGLVVLLMVVIALVGLRNLGSDAGVAQDHVEERYPTTVEVTAIERNLNVIARSIRNLLLVSDPAELEKERDRIFDARKRSVRRWQRWKSVWSDDKGKEIMKGVVEARSRYVADQEKLLKLIGENKRDEAKAVLLTEGRQVLGAYMEVLGNLVQHQAALMEEATKQAEATYTEAHPSDDHAWRRCNAAGYQRRASG